MEKAKISIMAFDITLLILAFSIIFLSIKYVKLIELYDNMKKHNKDVDEQIKRVNQQQRRKVQNNNRYNGEEFRSFYNQQPSGSYQRRPGVDDSFTEYNQYYAEQKSSREQQMNPTNYKVEDFPKCYEILGFKEKPKSEKEIKDKYKAFAKTLHPDVGGSEAMFKDLNTAYMEALKFYKENNGGNENEDEK